MCIRDRVVLDEIAPAERELPRDVGEARELEPPRLDGGGEEGPVPDPGQRPQALDPEPGPGEYPEQARGELEPDQPHVGAQGDISEDEVEELGKLAVRKLRCVAHHHLAGGPGAGIAPSGGDAAVTLRGAANTAITGLALDGTNTSSYAISLRFSDLILDGGSVTGGKAAGLYAGNTSSVNVQGVAMTDNDTAMTIINHSYANVTAGTRIERSKFIGVIASRTSSVTFGGGSVIDGVDNGVGVGVAASGYFLLRENAAITNVNGAGVEVRGAAFGVQEGSITAVTGDAINAIGASSVMLDRATITGNGGRGVRLDGSSGGEYRLSTITGNAGGALSISPDSEFINAGGNTVGP